MEPISDDKKKTAPSSSSFIFLNKNNSSIRKARSQKPQTKIKQNSVLINTKQPQIEYKNPFIVTLLNMKSNAKIIKSI